MAYGLLPSIGTTLQSNLSERFVVTAVHKQYDPYEVHLISKEAKYHLGYCY